MLNIKLSLLILLTLNTMTYAADTVSDITEEELMGQIEVDSEFSEEEPEAFDESKYIEELDEVDYTADDEKKYQSIDPDLLEDDLPDIKFDLVNEIRKKDTISEITLNKILNSKSKRSYSFAEKEALKIKLQDIVESGTFYGAIRKRTKLIHMRTGEIFYNQKLLTVKAFRKNDYEGYKLLLNKNGFITYKVLASQIENIKEISKLYEAPATYKVETKKTDFNIVDKNLNSKLQFNFHAGITNSDFFKELGRGQSGISQSVRYEGQAFGYFKFPALLGLSVVYENTFANFAAGGKYTIDSLSMGPLIKSRDKKIGKAYYNGFVSIRHAVFAKASIESQVIRGEYNLTQTSFVMGGERKVKTFVGDLMLGLNYQRQWLKASSKSLASQVSSQNNITDSFMASIGIRGDFL